MKGIMRNKKSLLWLPVVLAMGAFLLNACGREADVTAFREKEALLRGEALADWVLKELGTQPAGEAGNAVILSVCDGEKRAGICTGTADTPGDAWEEAARKAEAAVRAGLNPVWVRADVVYLSERVTAEQLDELLRTPESDDLHYGVALDAEFQTVLPETELNGRQICDGATGGVSLDRLNACLERNGAKRVTALPEEYILFQCAGWFCDEADRISRLSASGGSYGRRIGENGEEKGGMDGTDAAGLALGAAACLEGLQREDGSFAREILPDTGEEAKGEDPGGQAAAIRALLACRRLAPDQVSDEKIDRAVDYLLSRVVRETPDRAYLIGEDAEEIRLGDSARAVMALADYMETFENVEHMQVCRTLANGILALLNRETGGYCQTLNPDFTRGKTGGEGDDGVATCALCRMYELTGEKDWLDAAQVAVYHFLEADYTDHRDMWVACTMNEITRYVPDRADYYVFALRNVQENRAQILEGPASGKDLELLMETFVMYDRILQAGITVEQFDEEAFPEMAESVTGRLRDGYLYPEKAMYTAMPVRMRGAFLSGTPEAYIRVEDMSHAICGYALYARYYDRLTARMTPEA